MAKDKEKRQLNPAAAALKKQKADALKKGKAAVAAQRNERLARRNPDRLERQIEELRGAEQDGRPLGTRDRQQLEQLERELRAVRKAREGLGDNAPRLGGGLRREFEGGGAGGGGGGRGGRGGGMLGKRRREGGRGWRREDGGEGGSGSETDEGVSDIAMPADVENEPPVPRRQRRPQNANETPLGQERRVPHALPEKPVQAQTVYSSAPQVRNLQKEAVSRFVPTAVAARKKLGNGQGRLLEPEEADSLERQGYIRERQTTSTQNGATRSSGTADMLDEEERFRREMEDLESCGNTNHVQDAHMDAESAAAEAVKEAEYRMMNDVAAGEDPSSAADKRLHQVEIEDVEDEG